MDRSVITNPSDPVATRLNVYLTNHHAQSSVEETLRAYAQTQMELNLNKVEDAEPRRYYPDAGMNIRLAPNFRTTTGFQPNYTGAQFQLAELYQHSPSIRQCVFIFEYFSTAVTSTQKLLAIQLARGTDTVAYEMASKILMPFLHVNTATQDEFNTIAIPRQYTSPQVFLRVNFFNSRTGKTILFHTTANSEEEETTFIPVTLQANNTYRFTNRAILGDIQLYESGTFNNTVDGSNPLVGKTIRPQIQIDRQTYHPLKKDLDIIP